MEVTNAASFTVVAIGHEQTHGFGLEVRISPKETGRVEGPYVGDLEGEACHIVINAKVTCQEADCDPTEGRFQVRKGEQLGFKSGGSTVYIRHHEDEWAPTRHTYKFAEKT